MIDQRTPEMESESKTIEIPECNVDKFWSKIQKMNNKAKKLKISEIVVETISIDKYPIWYTYNWEGNVTRTESRTEEVAKKLEESGWIKTGRLATYHTFSISGNKPHVGGYKMIAGIDHGPEGNFIGNLTNEAIPDEFRTRQICDHCQTRRNRNRSILLEKDGKFFQIGKKCIADFLSEIEAQSVVSYLSWVKDLNGIEPDYDDEERERSYRSSDISIMAVLTNAAAIIRENGFLGTRRAAEINKERADGNLVTATSWRVDYNMAETTKKKDRVEILDEDRETAKKVREWLKSLESERQAVEYLYNLSLISKQDFCTQRQFSTLVSAQVGYEKATGVIKEAKVRDNQFSKSQFVGKVKERIDIDLMFDGSQIIESDFGSSQLMKFHDESGNLFVWFNSGARVTLNEGDTWKVRATIKKHDIRNNVRQTMLMVVKERVEKVKKPKKEKVAS